MRLPVLALDVGGTSVKSAIVDPSGQLAGPPRRTPIDSAASAAALLDALAGAVDALAPATGPAIAGVAIAFPGPCDYERGIPGHHDDGKFAALAGVDLRCEMRRRLGRDDLAIGFCNDAEAAIVAEALHGAGRPFERVLGITLGAGLGACLVAGDAIVAADAGVVPGELYREPFGDATADDAFSDRGLRARLEGADPASARDEDALAAFAAFGADLGGFLAPRTARAGRRCRGRGRRHRGRLRAVRTGARGRAGPSGARRRTGRGRRTDRRGQRARWPHAAACAKVG